MALSRPVGLVLLLAAVVAPSSVRVGDLQVEVCTDSIFRITALPPQGTMSQLPPSLMVNAKWPDVPYSKHDNGTAVTVSTSQLTAVVDKASLQVQFSRPDGSVVLEEAGRAFTPTKDEGTPSFAVWQSWVSTPGDEQIYGGGQFQDGILGLQGAPVKLLQFNTEAVVPFFVSTKGYGLLWDNNAASWLNHDKDMQMLHKVTGNGTVLFNFTASWDGEHFLLSDFAKEVSYGAATLGSPSVCITMWPARDSASSSVVQCWLNIQNLPDTLVGRTPALRKGSVYTVNVTTMGMKMPSFPLYLRSSESYGLTAIHSDVASAIDYYFMLSADGSVDGAVSLYRQATGVAPMYGKWAYGFWQCKERYHNRTELLNAAKQFRLRKLPVDNIVQDWHYWGNLGWGPHWDPAIYPDPASMVAELTELNFHFMVSVWSKFDPRTSFYKTLAQRKQLINSTVWFDAYNPAARDTFYDFANKSMFSIGVCCLWLDATEPEGLVNANRTVYLGSGNRYMNPYSLMVTAGVRKHYLRDRPNTRPFALTRSSFAGQQRTGAALWSGDTAGTWDMFRRQVYASLNYQLSGIPYWSEDIGGFFRPADQYTSPDYHDLLVRWFQFGAFTPIFRVHGCESNTEYWNYGPAVEQRILLVDQLRYRCLPYIYTMAHATEVRSYTMQRALVFDFAYDRSVWSVGDQFMWGPALMVGPIVSRVTQRSMYFPANTSWVNFWTGEVVTAGPSGRSQVVDAPIDHIPLFGRVGTILSLGPLLQYTNEKPADPLEFRVFAGAAASAEVYEDDGETQEYRTSRSFATFKVSWDQETSTFSVSERQGSFPGMLTNRTLHVVLVRPKHGVGVQPVETPDAVIRYSGQSASVRVQQPVNTEL